MSVSLAVDGRIDAVDDSVARNARRGNPVMIDHATSADVVAIAALDTAAFPDRPWSAELWATEVAGRSWVAVIREAEVAGPGMIVDSGTGRSGDATEQDGAVHACTRPDEGTTRGDLAGVIALSRADAASEVADLDRVVVRPDLRGRGLGDALVRAGLAWASAQGATRVLLEVEDTNATAHRLYERCGFAAIGARRNYYGPGRDAVIMQTVLPAEDATQAGRTASNGDMWLLCPPQVYIETEGDADE